MPFLQISSSYIAIYWPKNYCRTEIFGFKKSWPFIQATNSCSRHTNNLTVNDQVPLTVQGLKWTSSWEYVVFEAVFCFVGACLKTNKKWKAPEWESHLRDTCVSSLKKVAQFWKRNVFSFKGVFAGFSCFCRRHQPDQAGDQLTVDPEAGLKTLETCAL